MGEHSLTLGIFGISVTGFFFLLKWLSNVDARTAIVNIMQKDLSEIKEALLGTMDKKGALTKLHDLALEIESIKLICKERHDK